MTDPTPARRPAPPRRKAVRAPSKATVDTPRPIDPDRDVAGRQRLIREAMVLFADKGFDGITVRDIAKASNVSVGLINHHFGSKEGLREAVDRHFMAQFEEVLTLSPPTSQGGPQGYSEWVDDWIQRHQSEWAVTVSYFRRALLEESDWGASLFTRFYAISRDSVVQMDAKGELRPEVDRLWLPFLMLFLELGTTLLDPYIRRVLGQSGFEEELWRRRHRAYLDLIRNGVSPKSRALA